MQREPGEPTASPIFKKRRLIKHATVGAGNSLLRHVRAIVEDQFAPSVSRVLRVTRVRLARCIESIEPVVMARRSICNVPSAGGAVQLGWIGHILIYWRHAFVHVSVAAEVQVDAVLVEERFEYLGAVCAGAAGGAEVEGSMA